MLIGLTPATSGSITAGGFEREQAHAVHEALDRAAAWRTRLDDVLPRRRRTHAWDVFVGARSLGGLGRSLAALQPPRRRPVAFDAVGAHAGVLR